MRVCALTLTVIADDPRVRRHGDALHAAGFDVVGVGMPGARSEPTEWPVVEVPGTRRTLGAKVLTGTKMQAARISTSAALRAYWSFPEHRDFLRAAVDVRADVYQANDWRVLPIAVEAASRTGGRYVYDSHELAVEENAANRLWALTFPPYVRAVEAEFIHGAAIVSTVCDTIAGLMADAYGLATRPLVVRNIPPYVETMARPVGDPVVVLYHGGYNKDRGLEDLIRSVSLWQPGFRLVLRGFGDPSFEARLRALAQTASIAGRVTFEPRAKLTELIQLANAADVGIYSIPLGNNQTRYCLPNKLFEYAMAGLAICLPDAPEMARIVRTYGLGELMMGTDPAGIADAVNRLTPGSIMAFKEASCAAARELNWQHESHRLVSAYERLGDDEPAAS